MPRLKGGRSTFVALLLGGRFALAPLVRVGLFVPFLLVGVLTPLLEGCGNRAPDTPVDPVFVYLIDTLRPDHLGCYGYPRNISPHIDAFADDAFLFSRAVTAAPWTRPAVAGLFTGLTPRLHGVRGRAGVLPLAFRTWPEAMQELGYRTVAVVTNQNITTTFGFHQGFDFFDVVTRGDATYLRSDQAHEDWLPFLDQEVEGPLFHYLHTMDPHFPYEPLPRFQVDFPDSLEYELAARADEKHREQAAVTIDQYDQEILQNDDSFGRFLQALKDHGLYENSWIVLLSDHGEEFWEHGRYGHGNSLHENLLHVPLIIRPPGGRRGPFRRELERLAKREFPTHALADLIGPHLSRRWKALAAYNAGLLGLGEKEIRANLPRPGHLIPPLRWASYQLDGRGGTALVQDRLKVEWRDMPRAGWVSWDLQTDPAETLAVWLSDPGSGSAARAPTEGSTPGTGKPSEGPAPQGPDRRQARLQEKIRAWSDRTARGLHLRYRGEGVAPPLRIVCRKGLHEAYLRPGPAPRRFRLRRGGTVAWRPLPGGELYLLGDREAQWLIAVGTQRKLQVLWPKPSSGSRLPLELEWKDFGQAVFSTSPRIDPDHLPEELQRNLRALGYIH